jgi:hypothetical protein
MTSANCKGSSYVSEFLEARTQELAITLSCEAAVYFFHAIYCSRILTVRFCTSFPH